MPILFGITVIELICISIFLILMVIGCAYDRGGKEAMKWWTLFIGLAIVVAWQWSEISFAGIWTAVRTWSFWQPIAIYIACGLVYSIVEFVLEVRRSQQYFAREWTKFRNETTEMRTPETNVKYTMTNAAILARAKDATASRDDKRQAESILNSFYLRTQKRDKLVRIEEDPSTLTFKPRIDKEILADDISAWTMLWPFYALSLFLGRFLTAVWDAISTFFVEMSGRFVRTMFSNTFRM